MIRISLPIACVVLALSALGPSPTVGAEAQQAGPRAAEPMGVGALLADLPFPGAGLSHDEILSRIGKRRSRRLRPVGTSSIVFQMKLDGDVDAAFRPKTQHHPSGHLAEIAAYRIGRALGLENVPPATFRRIKRDDLERQLHPDFADALPEILEWMVWDEEGYAEGAAVYWVPDMRPLPLEGRDNIERWSSKLKVDAGRPQKDASLLRDISRMVAFDYLIANWDRFSGANAQGTPAGDRLYVRDHNIAFAAPLSRTLHRRVWRHVTRVERFERDFIKRLVALDAHALARVLALPEGAKYGPLLTERQASDFLDRRKALLSYVGGLVAAHGQDEVLSF